MVGATAKNGGRGKAPAHKCVNQKRSILARRMQAMTEENGGRGKD